MTLRVRPQHDKSTVIVDNYKALNNLSGLEFRFAHFSATGFIIASSTDSVAGVIANGGAASAQQVTIHCWGRSQLKMGGTCAAFDALIADASGYGLASASDNSAIGAIALANCSAAGQIISVIVVAGFRY